MTMVLFVTGISGLIHLYSIGYMKGDKDYPKFFLYMNLFVASMLILVLGSNLSGDLRRVGGGGDLLVLAGLLLVHPGVGGQCRQEGLHLQPDRRRRLPVGHLPGLRQGPLARVHDHLRQHRLHRGRQHHRHLPAAPGRGDGQVGADPAVPVAGRRHGGPDAGVRPHPRGHHGDRRGLPAVPDQSAAPRLPGGGVDRGLRGGGHRLRGRHHRLRPAGHQEGAGLLHGVPARVHVPGHRVRGLRGGHLLDGGPRLLQGPALPRRRLGDPRPPRRAGPQADGQSPGLHADHLHHLRHRLAGHRRRAPAVGILGQGGRAREHLGRPPGPVGGGRGDCRPHRLLHEPPDRTGLLRQGPLGREDAHRRGHRHARRPPRRRGHPRAPRVEADHDHPPVDPGLLRRHRRRAGVVQRPCLAVQLGRSGLRVQPLRRPPQHGRRLDAVDRRRRHRRGRCVRRPPTVDGQGRAPAAGGQLPPGTPGTSTSSTTPSSAGLPSGWPRSAPR